MNTYQELLARGFVQQTSTEDFAAVLAERRTIYHGIDPSANSAHVGNLAVWFLLRHLAAAGHKIVFLVGGATGRIGDPKPDVERPLLPEATIEENISHLRSQAESFFGAEADITFVNNYDWFQDIKFIDFLRDTGKHFTVNDLIKKDAVAKRLTSDVGLSYTEFAYPLIQGYDYLELYRRYDCSVQVGGSDQWGNMVAGVDLVRRVEQASVYVLTVPLVIDKATGKKFGKSEGNAIWLDEKKTSPYEFYQFWLNVSDESVIEYLKLYTLLPLKTIEELSLVHNQNPGKRAAQTALANAVTTLVHNEATTTAVANVSSILFGSADIAALSDTERAILLANAPTTTITIGTVLQEVLVAAGLATSKRKARTFIENGSVRVGGMLVYNPKEPLIPTTNESLVLVQRGKKKCCVVEFTAQTD